MRKLILAGLVIVCSVIIIMSFFMPWAKVKTSATKISKELTAKAEGELKNTPFAGKFIKNLDKATKQIEAIGDIEIKTQVSGYDIPTMVNKKSSQIALSFAQAFFKDVKDLDKKSMLVFLLPLCAIFSIILALAGVKYEWPVVLMLILSGIIALAGLYNLKTANFSSTVVEVTIEKGLWQTMYGYLAIFIISIGWLISDLKRS